MNYSETVEYLFSQLPMFQRVGQSAYKKDLGNTLALCKHLGNPETRFKSIHIAGTNGKGSTSHMLASYFKQKGLKTGLYTSPHLIDFRERIRINGIPVPEKFVIDFTENNKAAFELISPSFFEMTVAMAFDYFAKEEVDIAIIETGLGGRLDSTNVINPILSVITNISFDHMDMLGNTLELIAIEKAGIIKENIPVVIGETNPETVKVFIEKAKKENAEIHFADQSFRLELKAYSHKGILFDVYENDQLIQPELFCDLNGNYQLKNIATFLQSILITEGKLDFPLISKSLSAVKITTGLMGRWQVLSEKPLTISDTGHNEAGIREILKQISTVDYENLHIVFGMVKDKEPGKVLSLLPKNAHYYFTKANIPRALDAEELKSKALEFQLKGDSFTSVTDAIKAAKFAANEQDLIFIGGSNFIVAEAIPMDN